MPTCQSCSHARTYTRGGQLMWQCASPPVRTAAAEKYAPERWPPGGRVYRPSSEKLEGRLFARHECANWENMDDGDSARVVRGEADQSPASGPQTAQEGRLAPSCANGAPRPLLTEAEAEYEVTA